MSSRAIRRLLALDERAFLQEAAPWLGHAPEGPARRFLARLIARHPFCLKLLGDPDLFPCARAIQLARLLSDDVPTFVGDLTVAVAEWASREPERLDGEAGNRLLDLLVALLGEGDVPFLSRFARASEPRLRGRAEKMLVAAQQRLEPERDLAEEQARLHAAHLQSIWGVDTEDTRRELMDAVSDPHPRVRCYAWTGLALLGDPRASREILVFAGHQDPRFRAAAARGMGVIGSSEFEYRLTQLARDPDRNVRHCALFAVKRLREREAALESVVPEEPEEIENHYQPLATTLELLGVRKGAAAANREQS